MSTEMDVCEQLVALTREAIEDYRREKGERPPRPGYEAHLRPWFRYIVRDPGMMRTVQDCRLIFIDAVLYQLGTDVDIKAENVREGVAIRMTNKTIGTSEPR